jgi:pimeloyl-ACP methyl ester carboxylesterase
MTRGEGPPLVLVHGITDSGLCWSRVARALEPHWNVIMVDGRGHGSSGHPGSYTFREHVADLTGVLAALDVGRPVLVGHSMGGPHAAAVAAADPSLVRALVLVDPHWSPGPEDPSAYDLESWESAVRSDTARSLDELLRMGQRAHPAWTAEDLEPWARAKQVVDPLVVHWLDSTADLDAWPRIVSRLRSPLLLVTGDPAVDGSVTVRSDTVALVSRLCNQLSVVHVPGAGHSIHRDRFESFIAALEEFLRGV